MIWGEVVFLRWSWGRIVRLNIDQLRLIKFTFQFPCTYICRISHPKESYICLQSREIQPNYPPVTGLDP